MCLNIYKSIGTVFFMNLKNILKILVKLGGIPINYSYIYR